MSRKGTSRREFIRTGTCLGGLVAMSSIGGRGSVRRSRLEVNLVPTAPGTSPNYWCTWGAQNYTIEGVDLLSHSQIADNLSERLLFDSPGWASNYFRKVCSDLFIVYDVGWDVEPGVEFDDARWKLGSQEVAVGKFPSCTGEPAERLTCLNELTRQAGWRGAALWVPAQIHLDGKNGRLRTPEEVEHFLRQRAQWSRQAGIPYWKVDYGARAGSLEFRRLMSRLVHETAPAVLLEHARNSGPVNDETVAWEPDLAVHHSGRFARWDNGRILQRDVELLRFSDVLRTYDVTAHFSISTTLDRVAQILRAASLTEGASGLVNCEDEPYIGAALGCTFGIMRHPLWRDIPNQPYDPRNVKKRIDEVTRAVRWQRIAPALPVDALPVILDDVDLVDDWTFHSGETWAYWLIGRHVIQAAPARVARGMDLPEVVSDDGVPFILASKHSNGAMAVASLPRLSKSQGFHHPRAHVTLDIGKGENPLGVFGKFRSITLRLDQGLGTRRVLAQDLSADTAFDITDEVHVEDKSVVLPGPVLEEVGLDGAEPGDLSEPGLVLVLRS